MCGPCGVGQHAKCNGLLKTEFGFCRCADHDHELEELRCDFCGAVGCAGDCPQRYEAMDDECYDEEV